MNINDVTQVVIAVMSLLTFVLTLIINTKVQIVKEETRVNGLREIQIEAMTNYLLTEKEKKNG